MNGKIDRRDFIKDWDSYNIINCKFFISFIFILRKCYIIGFFVFFFIGERYGDLVGELFWKLLEEVFFFIWVGWGFVFRGV